MKPIIKIIVGNNTITVSGTEVNFDFVELPYGAIGYRNNGTSTSSEDNLNLYWSFVDEVLSISNISTDEYVTLKSIEDSNNFYGII